MDNSSSQTGTGIQPNGLPHGVKRKTLLTPADRAEKARRIHQPERADLDDIGFWPKHRGGFGIIPYHMHNRVLPDICKNKTDVKRYGVVRLCVVPQYARAEWREANKKRCETDPLMPKYSSRMWLVCLTNTHFTHSHKLCKDGSRSQLNQGKLPAKLRDDDTEGAMIQAQGPKVVIYLSLIHI